MISPLDEPEAPTLRPAPVQLPGSGSPSTSKAPLTIELPSQPSHAGNTESGEEQGEDVHGLDLGAGNIVKLDKLGPMIINSDGTISRIQNWQELHPIEQERTVRLLVKKRNLVRLQNLDGENTAGDGAGEELSTLKEAKEGR